MRKRIPLFTLIGSLFITFCNVEAQQQATTGQKTNEIFINLNHEEYSKRSTAIDPKIIISVMEIIGSRLTERYGSVEKALEAPEGEAVSLVTGIPQFIGTSNIFWNEGKMQEAVVKKYLARIKLIPLVSEDDWTEALTKANSGSKLKLPINLGLIIVQDRLFDNNGFKQEESKKLLTRLKSIPQDAIKKWADARQLAEAQAAISLISIDSLFIKDVFQPNLFTRKLQEMTR